MDSVGAVTVEASCGRPKDNIWYENAVVECNLLTLEKVLADGCSGGCDASRGCVGNNFT